MRIGKRSWFSLGLLFVLIGCAGWGEKAYAAEGLGVERIKVEGKGKVSGFKLSEGLDEVVWAGDDRLVLLTRARNAAGRRNRKLVLFDTKKGKVERVLIETTEVILSPRAWMGGKRIGCTRWGSGKGGVCEVLMWDGKTGKAMGALQGEKLTGLGVAFSSDPLGLAVSSDGRYVAAGTKIVNQGRLTGAHIGGEVCVWDARERQIKWFNRVTHTDDVVALAFASKARRLLSGGKDGVVRVWDVESGKLVKSLVGVGRGGVTGLAVSGDGKIAASGGSGLEEGGNVHLWDVEKGKLKHRFPAFRRHSSVRVALSKDERTMYAVGQARNSTQGDVRFRIWSWDVGSGKVKGRLLEHRGYARSIDVSGDGGRLVVGTVEGEVLIVPLGG